MTLTFDLLTLNSCHTWRVTWTTLPPSLKTLRLSVLELSVITLPVGYHWKCVCGHCACTESRDPWVGGKKQLHFWNSRPQFASLYNFCWAPTTINSRLLSSGQMLKLFSGGKILSHRNWAQNDGFLGEWGSKPWILVSRPPKGTFLCGIASFDVFCV